MTRGKQTGRKNTRTRPNITSGSGPKMATPHLLHLVEKKRNAVSGHSLDHFVPSPSSFVSGTRMSLLLAWATNLSHSTHPTPQLPENFSRSQTILRPFHSTVPYFSTHLACLSGLPLSGIRSPLACHAVEQISPQNLDCRYSSHLRGQMGV